MKNITEEDLQSLEGSIRTFGPIGPMYIIGKPVEELPDGDWLFEIEVLLSKERLNYKASEMLKDPLAT